jgi:TonB family protein
MNLSWWLHNLAAYSLQIALLVMVGSLLPPVLRLRMPAALLLHWQGLLGICLLLPAIQPWKQTFTNAVADVSIAVRPVSISGSKTAAFPIFEAVALAIAIGAAARLAFLAAGFWRLRRYRRNARPLREIPASVRQMQALAGARADMCVSAEVHSPVTFGIVRPAILFPVRFLEMSPEIQAAVACHELLHVRRKDWLFTIAEELLRAVLWFHPAIWWLLGQIQLAREQAVDRQVVDLTKRRDPYLEALLEIAGAKARADLSPAPLFLRKRHLARRVSSILKEVSMSKSRLAISLATICGCIFAAGRLAVLTFPLQAPPAAAQENKSNPPERIRVGGNVQSAKVIYRVKPVYPREAKAAGREGRVELQVLIARDGSVQDVEVISGDPPFTDAAGEAVRQWRYSPTLLNGEPIAVETQVDVNFTLSNSAGNRPVFRVGNGVTAPRVQYKVEPEYTPEARDAKIQGTVVLSVEISPEGVAQNVRVEESLDPGLDQKAMDAVKQWRFQPGTKDGEAVTVQATIEINFRLN